MNQSSLLWNQPKRFSSWMIGKITKNKLYQTMQYENIIAKISMARFTGYRLKTLVLGSSIHHSQIAQYVDKRYADHDLILNHFVSQSPTVGHTGGPYGLPIQKFRTSLNEHKAMRHCHALTMNIRIGWTRRYHNLCMDAMHRLVQMWTKYTAWHEAGWAFMDWAGNTREKGGGLAAHHDLLGQI